MHLGGEGVCALRQGSDSSAACSEVEKHQQIIFKNLIPNSTTLQSLGEILETSSAKDGLIHSSFNYVETPKTW